MASTFIHSFIDFKKAFDSIIRNESWNILKHYGIPDIYVNIIKKMYDGSTTCVIENGKQLTGSFKF